MPLQPGERLGPYEVITPIGAGGMGEVFKARDTRLERTVALKVLPLSLASDPEFKARFEREAKSISALNHPHICTLYDVGSQDGTDFLVMEYLEGETLAARLAKGALPSDHALDYAMQIADALDKAHRQGIVHRDLKPANVFLLKGASASGPGTCKLLDFGLAKVGAAAPAGTIETRLMTATPTRAANATTPLTAQGSILGTFQYMAPEQIEGQEADARADIWAFGCVLYEMLTGRRAFEGKSQASLIASILERQPAPITELQPLAPPALGRIVRTCLEKHPDNRFHTAHDLWLQLQWIEEGGSAAGLPAPVVAGRRRRDRVGFAAAALVLAALAAFGAWALKPVPTVTNVPARFSVPLPEGVEFSRGGRRNVAISPDGTKIAYIADQQIYLRQIHETVTQPIRGTNVDPVELAFSPDGEWLAFFMPSSIGAGLDDAVLKKIAVTGGTPVGLGVSGAPRGLRWQGGTILFSAGGRIQTVPDTGNSEPTTIASRLDNEPEQLEQPQLLNEGRDVLYTVRPTGSSTGTAQIAVQRVSGGERRTLVASGTDGRLLPGGTLAFVRDNTLFVQAFDAAGLRVSGGAIPLIEGVRVAGTTGAGQFDVADNGTLIFAPGSTVEGSAMVWVDRQGREEALAAARQEYYLPRVSPDGSKVAVSTSGTSERDLFVWDDQRKTMTKLTSDAGEESYPVWSRDSRFLYYRANPDGAFDVFRRSADGAGTAERLTTSKETNTTPLSLLPGGEKLLVRVGISATDMNTRLMALPVSGESTLEAVMTTSVFGSAEVSPDGRWLLYESNETGTSEIWVRPFPATDSRRWKISNAGGERPLWSRSGREIYFVSRGGGDRRLMAVQVPPAGAGAEFSYGTPAPLLDASRYQFVSIGRTYDVAPGDQRFIFLQRPSAGAEAASSVEVIVHWLDEVRARVGGR